MTKIEAKAYSPLTLAFLGDSVYELYIREKLVRQANTSAGKLHEKKIKYVCAEKQAENADKLMPFLTEEEIAIFKRGRNSAPKPPKHASLSEYHKATGLECLFGYLYLCEEKDRLNELLQMTKDF
jgi:ribonuclease-3 family protein